ncbi:hypothetical protein BC332_33003 [Capsicum chinense]|nr:hypothetical protein BC332_33003 [Capsicum chinense]
MDASASSPHLRKSGSRAVVSDFGAFEPGSGFEEEALLHGLEANEMKGVSIPSSTTAPSPVLLWRLKISWDSVMRMSLNLRDLFLYEAFLYYNPLLLVTLVVWFWGMNLWVFAQANVDFARIFDVDRNHLTHREIWKPIPIGISIVTVGACWSQLVSLNMEGSKPNAQRIEASKDIGSGLLYLIRSRSGKELEIDSVGRLPRILVRWSSLDLLLLAFSSPRSDVPTFHYRPLQALLIVPNLDSSSRLIIEKLTGRACEKHCLLESSDFVSALPEKTFCLLLMFQKDVATIAWFEADSVCGSHSVAIPIVLVLPYLFRLFQCLRQYKDIRDRTTLFNALKYSTAVPVIFLSALKYHVVPDNWVNLYRPLWLLSAVVNCLYSFYWDLTRDWDLSCFTRIFKFTRPHILSHLLYERKWVYFWVIGSNLILRCTWTYKLSAHLRHNYFTVFAITALEIFRRFQWAFFRVENAWNNISTKSNSQVFSMADVPKEEELLNSNGHNV